jgi:hypothetical protein
VDGFMYLGIAGTNYPIRTLERWNIAGCADLNINDVPLP